MSFVDRGNVIIEKTKTKIIFFKLDISISLKDMKTCGFELHVVTKTVAVPLHPFGTAEGDITLTLANDACSEGIDLPLGIPMFGKMKKTVHVINTLFCLLT